MDLPRILHQVHGLAAISTACAAALRRQLICGPDKRASDMAVSTALQQRYRQCSSSRPSLRQRFPLARMNETYYPIDVSRHLCSSLRLQRFAAGDVSVPFGYCVFPCLRLERFLLRSKPVIAPVAPHPRALLALGLPPPPSAPARQLGPGPSLLDAPGRIGAGGGGAGGAGCGEAGGKPEGTWGECVLDGITYVCTPVPGPAVSSDMQPGRASSASDIKGAATGPADSGWIS